MPASARIRITKININAISSQLEPPMNALGNALARRMQRLVPKRTWNLHDTIKNYGVERSSASVMVTVGFGGIAPSGVDVDYGLYVERGTSKMSAQPFARPALLQTRPSDMTSSVLVNPPRRGGGLS